MAVALMEKVRSVRSVEVMRKNVLLGWCFAALMFAPAVAFQAAEIIPLGATWKYRLGTQEASSPISAWRQIVFDDSAWDAGGPIPWRRGWDHSGTPSLAPGS